MEKVYMTIPGDQVTEAMLEEAAKLFSKNYGRWGQNSRKPGEPVNLNARRLREQYLPEPAAAASYIKVTVDGDFAGNAFAYRWKVDGKTVCWVTQLVVDRNYRDRGLAGDLLRSLRSNEDNIYGIMSSHPAACLAAAKSFGAGIEIVRLDFMKGNAEAIMKASPIPYVRKAKLCGTLFKHEDQTGLVCGVNTGFFVDHKEPLEALESIQQDWQWPLGALPDGHEYLLVLQSKRHRLRSPKPETDAIPCS